MKFCANLSFMFAEGATILERYSLAKDAGFKAVETGFPFGHTLEQVKQAKESAGVQQVLINLKTGKSKLFQLRTSVYIYYPRFLAENLSVCVKNITGDVTKGELGVTAIPGRENDFKDDLKVTIEYAKALDAKKIHIMAGKLENATTKNWETYENNLRYAADALKKSNLLGVIEPINQHSVPKYFLSDYGKGKVYYNRQHGNNIKSI